MVIHADEQVQSGKAEKSNQTGIPDSLKKKFEEASGFSLSDVKVHYNSDEPKKIKALAYTQGSEVHIAPGQEKHLEHELQHVIQQKEGRVKPTGFVNGMQINDNPSLEAEASVPIQRATDKNMKPKDILLGSEAPVQMMEEEKESVFDVEKIKTNISELIQTINKSPNSKGWPSKVPDEPVLKEYAIRIQELLEDIRQVDLRFLAATAISYEEDTRKAPETTENALTEKERALFKIPVKANETEKDAKIRDEKEKKLMEEQQRSKGILLEKLQYLKEIRNRVGQRFEINKNKYNLAKSNLGRARKEKVIKSLTKTMNQSEMEYKSSEKYLQDLNEQIELIENTLKNAGSKGYIFNQNRLLTKIDGKIKLYMAIVAPSETRKDIITEGDGLKTSGQMHQWGISTPVRAFSWLTKYLMDKSALSNTAPLIRTLSANPEAISELQERSVSESFKQGDTTEPQNEDFKVPDQYGMAPESDAFKNLIASKPELESFALTEVMPADLQEGLGGKKSYDDFKKVIGFSRRKGPEVDGSKEEKATEVHFLDKEHTAFHEISNNKAPSLYSPNSAAENAKKYNAMMDRFIHYFGKDAYVKNAEKKGIVTVGSDSVEKVMTELKELLEANHCLLPASTDIYGNSTSAKESEQKFALKQIGTADGALTSLINLTELRFSTLINRENSKKRNKVIETLKDSIGLKLEVELLTDALKKEGKDFSTKDLFNTNENVLNYFDALKKLDKTEPETKLRVTAFCFKMLRTIMDNIQSTSPQITLNPEYDQTEEMLFSKRENGDYYDVLNRKDHKIIPAREDDPESKSMRVPYDKLTSKGRFKPTEDKTKKGEIPFVGGASGTTRDMTRDLMERSVGDANQKNKWLKSDKDFWNFQLMNAAFMITYDYHSFVEVFFRAATTRLEYNPNDKIAQSVYKYLKLIANNTIKDAKNEKIIESIKKIIERGIK